MTETEGNTVQMRRLAGEVFVDDFGRRNRWCELDWQIGPAFQGRGYAAEAASAAMEFLLSEAGFHRVQAKCAAENAASLRVMEKLGMRREGVLPRPGGALSRRGALRAGAGESMTEQAALRGGSIDGVLFARNYGNLDAGASAGALPRRGALRAVYGRKYDGANGAEGHIHRLVGGLGGQLSA